MYPPIEMGGIMAPPRPLFFVKLPADAPGHRRPLQGPGDAPLEGLQVRGPRAVLLLHPLPGVGVLHGDAGDDAVLLPHLGGGVAHLPPERPEGLVQAGHHRPGVDEGCDGGLPVLAGDDLPLNLFRRKGPPQNRDRLVRLHPLPPFTSPRGAFWPPGPHSSTIQMTFSMAKLRSWALTSTTCSGFSRISRSV